MKHKLKIKKIIYLPEKNIFHFLISLDTEKGTVGFSNLIFAHFYWHTVGLTTNNPEIV